MLSGMIDAQKHKICARACASSNSVLHGAVLRNLSYTVGALVRKEGSVTDLDPCGAVVRRAPPAVRGWSVLYRARRVTLRIKLNLQYPVRYMDMVHMRHMDDGAIALPLHSPTRAGRKWCVLRPVAVLHSTPPTLKL